MPNSSRLRSKNSRTRVAMGPTGVGASLYRMLDRLARTSIFIAALLAAACDVSTNRVALCGANTAPANSEVTLDLDQMMVVGTDYQLGIDTVRTNSAVGMISPMQLMVPSKPITTFDTYQKWETSGYVFTMSRVPFAAWFIVHAEPIDKETTLQSWARETTALFSTTEGLLGYRRHFYEHSQFDNTVTVCRGSRLRLENVVPPDLP
jgi:hypothetical protein